MAEIAIINQEDDMNLKGIREDLGRVEERKEEGGKDVNLI